MRLEVAFVVLAVGLAFVVFGVMFSDEGQVAPDGGDDDLGSLAAILTFGCSIAVLVAAVVLVGVLEVALWATRSSRRRTGPDR